jgi:hypothetical protein
MKWPLCEIPNKYCAHGLLTVALPLVDSGSTTISKATDMTSLDHISQCPQADLLRHQHGDAAGRTVCRHNVTQELTKCPSQLEIALQAGVIVFTEP